MIKIIGNSLNACNKKVLDKMNKMDFEYIRKESVEQISNGAEFIEINAVSLLDNELPFLMKVVPIIEKAGGKIYIRSKSIDTIIKVIEIAQNELIIGDIEFEKEKIDRLTGYIKEKDIKIAALIKDKKGGELYPEKSLLIAQLYIDYLLDAGIERKKILLDPVVKPLEENYTNGKTFLNTLELFKLDFPQIRTIASLPVLSESMPSRKTINAYFLSLAIENGLDYFVINVMDEATISSITSTLSIIGKDKNCQNYMKYCRDKKKHKDKEPVNE